MYLASYPSHHSPTDFADEPFFLLLGVSVATFACDDALNETSVLREFDCLYSTHYQLLWSYLNRVSDAAKENCGPEIRTLIRLAGIGKANAEYTEWVHESIEVLSISCPSEFVRTWEQDENSDVVKILKNPIYHDKELIVRAIRASSKTSMRQKLLNALSE